MEMMKDQICKTCGQPTKEMERRIHTPPTGETLYYCLKCSEEVVKTLNPTNNKRSYEK